MGFDELIRQMTNSIVEGDGSRTASYFSEDGFYHDVFYGVFKKPAISDLVENYFHKDAENFKWEICETSNNREFGFAKYVFSYDSKMSESYGKRAIFEGVAICGLTSGLINSYREVANVYTGLSMLGFNSDRLSKTAARQTEFLKASVSNDHLRFGK